MGGNSDEEDAWDAFGSDSDDDDNDNNNGNGKSGAEQTCDGASNGKASSATAATAQGWKEVASALALNLSQEFLKSNAQVKLQDRVVGLAISQIDENGSSGNTTTSITGGDWQLLERAIRQHVQQRGIQITSPSGITCTESAMSPDTTIETQEADSNSLDALIIVDDAQQQNDISMVMPGGIIMLLLRQASGRSVSIEDLPDHLRKHVAKSTIKTIYSNESKHNTLGPSISLLAMKKHCIQAHTSICPWLPSSHKITTEQAFLEDATTTLSASEARSSTMTEHSIQRAANALSKHGYCIIRQILNPHECQQFGNAVLQTVHDAAKILKERDHVDIYNPQNSEFEPQAYQELSMREDLRLDIRHGSQLSKLRKSIEGNSGGDGKDDDDIGNANRIVKSNNRTTSTTPDGFLRGHKDLLDIVRTCMSPKDEALYRGNMGRYNFEGSGPDGSFQDLRVSPVGGIVSFPGAAEQALHADTPHLFEHVPDLPAHYVNIFTPGAAFDEEVGGTAFVHGSHDLRFTARHCGEADDNVYPFLVRPCLTLGDVVMFDCRILHFGLANNSKTKERPLLYTNTTQAWFLDPKNWNDKARIFEEHGI